MPRFIDVHRRSPNLRPIRARVLAGSVAVLAIGLSCGDDPIAPRQAEVGSVVLSVDVLAIEPGDSAEVRAEARRVDGVPLPPSSIEWSALDPSVATVSDDGFVLAHLPGTARIVAQARRHSDTVEVIVPEPIVETMLSSRLDTIPQVRGAITVTLSSRSAAGTREGRYSVISRDPTIALPRLADATGELTIVGENPGATWIVVTERGGTADSIRIVVAQRAHSIELRDDLISGVGASAQLEAVVRDATGRTIAAPGIVWSSADPGIASVSPTGLVRLVAGGATVIEARVGDVTAVVEVTVTSSGIPRIAFAADSTVVGAGLLAPSVFVTLIGPIGTPQLEVVSLDPAIADVHTLIPSSAGGILTVVGRQPGRARLVASAGSLPPDTLIVRVTRSRVRIVGYYDHAPFTADETAVTPQQYYGVTIQDSAGTTLQRAGPTTVTLASSDPSVLRMTSGNEVTLGPQFGIQFFSVTPLAAGRVMLRASAPGMVSDSVAITVTSRPRLRVRWSKVHTVALGHTTLGMSHHVSTTLGIDRGTVVPVTVTQRHPEIVAVSPTLTMPSNSSGVSIEYQGLALGVDTIVFSAPGYDPDTAIVIVTSPTVEAVAPVAATVGFGASVPLRLVDSLGFWNVPLEPVVFHVASSNPAVATPPGRLEIPARWSNPWQANLGVVDTGSATITFTDSSGRGRPWSVSLRVRSDTTLHFVDVPDGVRTAIGMRQRFPDDAFMVVRESNRPTTIYLRSTDPSILRVPDSVVIATGYSAAVRVSGGEASGSASITVSARGYRTRTFGPVDVGRPRLDLTAPDSAYVGGTGYTVGVVSRDHHGVERRTDETLPIVLDPIDGGLTASMSTPTIPAGGSRNDGNALSITAPGALRLVARDARSAAYRYDADTAVVRAILPPLSFGDEAPITVGIGQRATTVLTRPANLIEGSASVTIARRGSRSASDAAVTISTGSRTATYQVVGREAGVDTLTPMAPGYSGRPVRVVVTEGRLLFPFGVPETVRSGQSIVLRLETGDIGGDPHPVDAPTTFHLWGTGVTFFSGGKPIDSITIPAGAGQSQQIDVVAGAAGTATFEVTNLNYRTARFRVTITP